MSTQLETTIAPVRIENGRQFTVAGLADHFTLATNKGIPALWERFARKAGKVPGQIGDATYGLCCNFDGHGGFLYIAGVEVSSTHSLPEEYTWHLVQPHRYAVFEHHGRLSGLGHTFEKIWKQWLPGSGERAANAAEFERYDERFDAESACSVMEIWIPLEH